VRLDMAASQVWYEGTPIKLTALLPRQSLLFVDADLKGCIVLNNDLNIPQTHS